jgi:hypothetical protein
MHGVLEDWLNKINNTELDDTLTTKSVAQLDQLAILTRVTKRNLEQNQQPPPSRATYQGAEHAGFFRKIFPVAPV